MESSNDDVIKAILHYQERLERYNSNNSEDKMLYVLNKLSKIPMKTSHLETTGIGRTVNALKKLSGIVGEGAKNLVMTWKDMVLAEERASQAVHKEIEDDAGSVYSENENEDCEMENDEENVNNQSTNESDTEEYSNRKETSSKSHSYLENKSSKYKNDGKDNKKRRDSSSSDRSSSSDNSSNSSSSDEQMSPRHDKHHSRKRTHSSESSSEDRSNHKSKKHKRDKDNSGSSKNKHNEQQLKQEKDKKPEKKDRHSSPSRSNNDKSESRHKSKRESEESHRKSDKHSKNEVKTEKDKKSSHSSSKHHSSNSHSNSSKKESKDKKEEKESKDRKEEKESKRKKEEKENKDRKEKKESKEKKEKDRRESKKESSRSKSPEKKIKENNSSSSSSSKEAKEKKHSKDSPSNSQSHPKDKSSHSESSKKKDKERKVKTNPEVKKKIINGIDCESGASFAEALGMCGPMSSHSSKKKSSEKNRVKPPEGKTSEGRTSEGKSSESSSGKKSKNEGSDSSSSKYVPALLVEEPPEPLNVCLSNLLPEITPNYKPTPLLLDSLPKRICTDEEALSRVMANKNQRTKVYSGNKTVGKVESLFQLCIRILQDNIDALEYTGGVPYLILKQILERATPDQLFNMEHHNPYLIEDTDELWQLHCQKDFRTKKREELESWREMYMRCLDEREAKLNFVTANIKQAQDKSEPVRTTKMAYIDSAFVKPPRNIARKQAKNGTVMTDRKVSPTQKLSAIAKSGDAEKVAVPNPASRAAERSSNSSSAAMKPKKAPLMAKTLSFLKNRFKR